MLEGNTKGAILVVTYEWRHTTTYIGVGSNFMLRVLVAFISFFILSCEKPKESMEYLLSWRNRGELDTIYADIIQKSGNDSLNIIKYRFDSRQKDSPAYEQEFTLPKNLDSVGINFVSLVYKRTLEFEGKDYTIYKYQIDYPNGDDEESLYFYTPDFGIILFHWGTHRNSQRLIKTGNVNNDKIIYYLTDKIENDYKMTKSW